MLVLAGRLTRLDRLTIPPFEGMTSPDSHDLTGLLKEVSAANRVAFDGLAPFVYQELRRVAKAWLRRELLEGC